MSLNRNKDKLYIAAVNYHQQEDIDCPIFIEGFSPGKEGKVYELNGPSVMATNNFDNPERIKIQTRIIKNTGPRFNYNFPSHSCTVIELHIK